MLSTYFGDVTSGRLLRLPFIGYLILLQVVMFALVMGGAASLGIAENLVGGNLQDAQAMLGEKFGIPAMIVIAIVMALYLFADLNLKAKRIRDMGLPGWWTLLAVIVISIVVTIVINIAFGSDPETSNRISSIFTAIAFLALLFIPSDTFSGNSE
jgi:uncharacterized membrane protein YhaH (DUF805 family)